MARYGTEGRGGGQRRGYGERSSRIEYDRDYGAGQRSMRGESIGGYAPDAGGAGRSPQARATPGPEMSYRARGTGDRGRYDREMLSNEYSRRLRGGWQRGYDRGLLGGSAATGYGSEYRSNRASSADENDYFRPGPTYGPRDSDFSRRGRGR